MTSPKLVFVMWLDACSCAGWTDLEEAKEARPDVCSTVGWLLHQDDERIVIAHTLSEHQVNGHMVIPAAWVEGEIRVIETPSNVVPMEPK